MSTSYNSGVILGVKLNEIGFNAKLQKSPYEIHDKKGKPTGKFDYDYNWIINFNGNVITTEDKKLYVDEIEEIINIKKPLNFFENTYEDFDVDNVIIGINLISKGYNDWNILKEISYLDKIDMVREELKKQFNVDVEPKLYFYFIVS